MRWPAALKRVLKTYLVPERLSAISLNPAASEAASVPATITKHDAQDFTELVNEHFARTST